MTKLTGLGILADHMTGDDWGRQSRIYNQMRHVSEPGPTLLYVTPEKLSASSSLLSALTSVYNRQRLTMFVIDEAHCVSQWGHDFRPDYKKLSTLRHNFPQVCFRNILQLYHLSIFLISGPIYCLDCHRHA